MVSSYIVYGFLVKRNDIENLFPADEYPHWYQESLDDDDTEKGKVLSEDFELSTIKEALDFDYEDDEDVENEEIGLYAIDFEYSNDFDKEGGDTIIIGIRLNSCEAHYVGVMEVPDIKDNTRKNITHFSDNNPRFKQLKPRLYVIIDADK